jgi:hypothetical protein
MEAKQMHTWRLRAIAAAVLVLIASGCGGSNPPSNPASNPLIGKWKLADQSESNFACINLVEVEFTEKTITTNVFGPVKNMKNTFTVTYGRDGDSYLASAGNGQAYRVKIESGGIEANGCHLVPASAKSSPLIGKWKLVPGQDEGCREQEKLEFTEDTMTMMVSEQAQKEEQMPSRSLSLAVTYSRDGDRYLVTGTKPSGESKVLANVQMESGGIEVFDPDGKNGGCHFAPAS